MIVITAAFVFVAACFFYGGLQAGQAIYDRHDRAMLTPTRKPVPSPPHCAHCGPPAAPKVATW